MKWKIELTQTMSTYMVVETEDGIDKHEVMKRTVNNQKFWDAARRAMASDGQGDEDLEFDVIYESKDPNDYVDMKLEKK